MRRTRGGGGGPRPTGPRPPGGPELGLGIPSGPLRAHLPKAEELSFSSTTGPDPAPGWLPSGPPAWATRNTWTAWLVCPLPTEGCRWSEGVTAGLSEGLGLPPNSWMVWENSGRAERRGGAGTLRCGGPAPQTGRWRVTGSGRLGFCGPGQHDCHRFFRLQRVHFGWSRCFLHSLCSAGETEAQSSEGMHIRPLGHRAEAGLDSRRADPELGL